MYESEFDAIILWTSNTISVTFWNVASHGDLAADLLECYLIVSTLVLYDPKEFVETEVPASHNRRFVDGCPSVIHELV